jgi:pyridoxamine 5'-phosphate oxidase
LHKINTTNSLIMLRDIHELRKDYQKAELLETKVRENPIQQFQSWFEEALQADADEPNAMVLATATPDGTPTARVVLLKGVSENGFVFYTNYQSHKGQDLKINPRVSAVFLWKELERQVRIEGLVDMLPESASTTYFQSRPKDSQIAAWASPQSKKLVSRTDLEDKFSQISAQYADAEQLPKPPHWGGYIIHPYKIEFWQGRPSRMHDRLVYTLTDVAPVKKWGIERLAP